MLDLNGLRNTVVHLLDKQLADLGNLLVYAYNKSDRDDYIDLLLEKYWKEYGQVIPEQIQPNIITFDGSKSCKPIYKASYYYTRVDMDASNIGDRVTGMALLNSLTSCSSIDKRKLVIILDRVDNMPTGMEQGMRKILELCHIQFILTASNISKLQGFLISRVLLLNCNKRANCARIPMLITQAVTQILGNRLALRSSDKIRIIANKLHSACIPFSIFAKEVIIQLKDIKNIYNLVDKTAQYELMFCTANKKILVYEAFLAELSIIMSSTSV